MPYPKYWTNNNLLKLRQLYDSGLSMREVGLHFNKSVWAINNIMKRNSIERRKSNQTKHLQFINSPLSFKSNHALIQTILS